MPWSPLPTPDGTGGPPPVKLDVLVDAVLAGLGAPEADAIVAIHERWGELVGDEVVAHVWPLAVEDGCLRIEADGPAWASHVRWAQADIVRRAATVLGAGVVTSVNVRVARARRR